jgi:transcriptional regulator with XRE-family HTH domain
MPTTKEKEVTPEQKIWKRLGELRQERGISPGFMAHRLEVDPSLLRRIESGEMKGLNLERISTYLAALKLRGYVIVPEGVLVLQPAELPMEQPRITTDVLRVG